MSQPLTKIQIQERAKRWAVVQKLESGKLATCSRRGHVDWSYAFEDAQRYVDMARKLFADRGDSPGYLLPDYKLYATPELFPPENLDKVVDLYVVSEEAWEAKKHHTVPFTISY